MEKAIGQPTRGGLQQAPGRRTPLIELRRAICPAAHQHHDRSVR
jgi:hypothetical protein